MQHLPPKAQSGHLKRAVRSAAVFAIAANAALVGCDVDNRTLEYESDRLFPDASLPPLPTANTGGAGGGGSGASGGPVDSGLPEFPEPSNPAEDRVFVILDIMARDWRLGGRLYDKWYVEPSFINQFEDRTTAFIPDDPTTPDAADGDFGPNGNGTLNNADGDVLWNEGHDYRLSSYFGWDLRGTDGISGADYQNLEFTVSTNLLDDELTRESFVRLILFGNQQLPAFGDLLSDQNVADITEFVFRMRDGDLPHSEQVWQPDERAPNRYVLKSGANVEQGVRNMERTCALLACHGRDGTTLNVTGGELSLGMHGRSRSFEAWLKMLVGHPGSTMGGQVPPLSAAKQGKFMLDVLAGLCDREKYPVGTATGTDVPDGDPRCGLYLK